MDTVRSEYSEDGTLASSRSSRAGMSVASLYSMADSVGSGSNSTARSDFLNNFEHKFLQRKAEKKRKKEREHRLATNNQPTADEKRRADREAERQTRKAEMASWLPTPEALRRIDRLGKKRARERMKSVLDWYPPIAPDQGDGSDIVPVEVHAHFSNAKPLVTDNENQASHCDAEVAALQKRLFQLQQKMSCVERITLEASKTGTTEQWHPQVRDRNSHRVPAKRMVHGVSRRPSPAALQPLSGGLMRSRSHTHSQSNAVLLTAGLPLGSTKMLSRSASSHVFRETPESEAAALVAESQELELFLAHHHRQHKRAHAIVVIQSTWRMYLRRYRFLRWRRWRARRRRFYWQVWVLSTRIQRQAQRATIRKYMRAWRDHIESVVTLQVIELRLFREAESQPTLPRIVINLVFTTSDYDDAYTRKVLACPTRNAYAVAGAGAITAAYAAIAAASAASEEQDADREAITELTRSMGSKYRNNRNQLHERGSPVLAARNRVRLLRAQHMEARRSIARRIVQHAFILWKRAHAAQQRQVLNAELCIKRAARLAFQARPMWAGEHLLTIFELWARWSAFKRAQRLRIPPSPPRFAHPLPLWDLWLHKYQERQVRQIKAAAREPLARMRRIFRSFCIRARSSLRYRRANKIAKDHYHFHAQHRHLIAWHACIAEAAAIKKIQRDALLAWGGYASQKKRLRPRRSEVSSMVRMREMQRAWGAWRHIQLRSMFSRELTCARLEATGSQWRTSMQRLVCLWMGLRSQWYKWKVFVAWHQYVQRRRLFLAARKHCLTLRRRHLLEGIFLAWKTAVWKQDADTISSNGANTNEFLEDRLYLSAGDAYDKLAPLMPMLFFGCLSEAAAVFAGVPIEVDERNEDSMIEDDDPEVGCQTEEAKRDDISGERKSSDAEKALQTALLTRCLAKRQKNIQGFHEALVQCSVTDAQELIGLSKHLVNGIDDVTGNSALHIVVQIEDAVRRCELTTLLLSEGATTQTRPNRYGLTPLDLSADTDARKLLLEGVYAFHARGVLKHNPEHTTAQPPDRRATNAVSKPDGKDPARLKIVCADSTNDNNSNAARETRLLWCLVSLMSSEYVRGDRIAGDLRREWHSVLRDELWLRQGRIYFSSSSEFTPTVRKCRAFLNGMKRRICRTKYDVLRDQKQSCSRTVGSRSDRSGLGLSRRPLLITSATRRMLTRDFSAVEERVDLMSWLSSPTHGGECDPTEAELREAEDIAIENSVRRIFQALSAEHSAFGELLLSPVLQDEAAEKDMVHSFVGVLYALQFSEEEVMAEVNRLEDKCVQLEQEVMKNYLGIIRAELRCRNPEQPTGLPLLRFFTEQEDAESFFHHELLLVDMELYRRHVVLQASMTTGMKEDEEMDEDEEEDTMSEFAQQLLMNIDLLLSRLQRKKRRVDKKTATNQEQLSGLEREMQGVFVGSPPYSMAEICKVRMDIEREKLRTTSICIKRIQLVDQITRVEGLRCELVASEEEREVMRELQSGNASEEESDNKERDGIDENVDVPKHTNSAGENLVQPRLPTSVSELSCASMSTDDLQAHRNFLNGQLARYLVAFRSMPSVSATGRSADVRGTRNELRCLHRAASGALWSLVIANLFRCCCCWLLENMTSVIHPSGNEGEIGGLRADKPLIAPPTIVEDEVEVDPVGLLADAGIRGYSSNRRLSLAVAGSSFRPHRRSSLSAARVVLESLQRNVQLAGHRSLASTAMEEAYVASSRLLFVEEREAMQSAEERAALQEKQRSHLTLHDEVNPITGEPEQPPIHLVDLADPPCGDDAGIASSRSTTARADLVNEDKGHPLRNRKREQLRLALQQRRLHESGEHQNDEVSGAIHTSRHSPDGKEAGESPASEIAGSTSSVANIMKKKTGSIPNIVDCSFGNFIGPRTPHSADTIPVESVSMESDQSHVILASFKNNNDAVASIPSARAAESLWKRGVAGRRPGNATVKGATSDLFSSAEDEMAFNNSFRISKTAGERKTTPAAPRRLDVTALVAASDKTKSIPMRDHAGSRMDTSPRGKSVLASAPETTEGVTSVVVDAHATDCCDSMTAVQADGLPLSELDQNGASTDESGHAIQTLESAALQVETMSPTDLANRIRNDCVSNPSAPSRFVSENVEAAGSFLDDIVSEAEESQFFNDTLKQYLQRVRQDSFVSVTVENRTRSRPSSSAAPKENQMNNCADSEKEGPTERGSTRRQRHLEQPMPPPNEVENVTTDSLSRAMTPPPYIKWEDCVAQSMLPALPHPLRVENTVLVSYVNHPVSLAKDDQDYISNPTEMDREAQLVELLLNEYRRTPYAHEFQEEASELTLSGTSAPIATKPQRTPLVATRKPVAQSHHNRKSGKSTRAGLSPMAQNLTVGNGDPPSATIRDSIGDGMGFPTISVAIQRKPSNPDVPISQEIQPALEICAEPDEPPHPEQGVCAPLKRQDSLSLAQPDLLSDIPKDNSPLGSPLRGVNQSIALEIDTRGPRATQAEVAVGPRVTKKAKLKRKMALKSKRQLPVRDPPNTLQLNGSRMLSSASLQNLRESTDNGKDVQLGGGQAEAVHLSTDQKRQVWQSFVKTLATDVVADAYAELYPHFHQPNTATPLPASGKPSAVIGTCYPTASMSNPTLASTKLGATSSNSTALLSMEEQIRRNKQFWSAVEGFKAQGAAAALIPMDPKTARTRQIDAAVGIFQQFLRDESLLRLPWLHMYPDKLHVIQKKLLHAPRDLFNDLQQTAQLQISAALSRPSDE